MGATSAGAVVVPIYQTNSPEECLWVISDSDACAIVCEDAEQLAKIAAIRDQIPNLRTIIVIDPPDADGRRQRRSDAVRPLGAIPLRGGPRARTRPLAPTSSRRAARPCKPEDPFTFIYTSGTTGPPKGCVLTHGNYRAIIDMVGEAGEIEGDEVIYLYLPLAHSFALLIQLAVFDLGGTLAYFGGDTKQIVPELQEVKPTYLPSVPRVFEKIYTLAHGAIEAQAPEEQERAAGGDRARREGARHDEPRRSRCPRSCRSPSTRPTSSCSRTCARSSAAACATRPAAPRRSPTRSSSSSAPAACPCSRATA